jgi:hypothetical protein
MMVSMLIKGFTLVFLVFIAITVVWLSKRFIFGKGKTNVVEVLR